MGFAEFVEKFGRRGKERKELLKQTEEQLRIQKIVQDRQKSANERELERYMNEDREKSIKEELDYYRKKREHDINFNHNPLKVENITNKKSWEVLKEKNQFANQGCMFENQSFLHKNNKKLLKNNKKLYSGGKVL